jgi:LDH2 family malate/lactate/ureidoglycolate dehydrogenase
MSTETQPEHVDVLLLSPDAAMDLALTSLGKIGYGPDQARIIADHLIDSALCGYRFIAFPRILQMLEHVQKYPQRGPITVERLTEVSARVHGHNEIGYLTNRKAAQVAIEIAREHRFALVGATHSVTSGRIGYYLEIIAKAGLVGIQFTGATSHDSPFSVAPFGGLVPALGTNPIAFSFPSEPEAVVFDIGTSATNGGDVRLAKRLGKLLPEGVAIDSEGSPTRDPNAVGAILPFGGYKGYGLAFIAQCFAVLAGSPLRRDNVRDWGALFIAFDPEMLMPLPDFKGYLARFVAELKATPRLEGVDEIRIPSERGFRERARRRVEGIEIDRPVYDALIAL